MAQVKFKRGFEGEEDYPESEEFEDKAVEVEVEVDPEPEQQETVNEESSIGKLSCSIRNFCPISSAEVEVGIGRELTEQERTLLMEDWHRGFRVLTPQEWQDYQLPESPDDYSTMEALSKNCLKVSARTGADWFKELESSAPWPPDYLCDRTGYTPECVAELIDYREYTREYRLPRESDGTLNIHKWQRGDLNNSSIREKNPRYGLRFTYWEEVKRRSLQWREWKKLKDQSTISTTEVSFGEFVETEGSLSLREERKSQLLSHIEGTERQFYNLIDEIGEAILAKLLPKAEEKGLEIRAEVSNALLGTIKNPTTTTEE